MATKYHQISLNDIFSDCQNSFIDDSPSFFSLLSEHLDLNEFIPPEFLTAFYLSVGHVCINCRGFLPLSFFKRFFHPYFLLFLHLSKELRDFCGFTKIPDASLMSRFKYDFESYIELMFQRMIDYTKPIC